MFAVNKALVALARPNKPVLVVSMRTLYSKDIYDWELPMYRKDRYDRIPKPRRNEHFPYKKLSYKNIFKGLDLSTEFKLDGNSKVVVVDGNVGSGKGEVAKKLAEAFGLKYYPSPELDEIYINSYGFDYRSLNDRLPEHIRTCDLNMWHEQPNRHSVIHMQHYYQMLRAYQYMDSLAHLLNTGQGVVLERSLFTERVFVESMHKMGWLPVGYTTPDGCEFYDWRHRYNQIRKYLCRSMLQPHLLVYVDTPPDECHRRLQQSKDENVRNSKALSLDFLKTMDETYKDLVIPYMDRFGHVVNFDNKHGLDETGFEALVDEIEQLSFYAFWMDQDFSSWNSDDMVGAGLFYHYERERFSVHKHLDFVYFGIPYYDIAGLGDSITKHDLTLRESIRENSIIGFKKKKYFDPKYTNWLSLFIGHRNFELNEKARLFLDFP